MKKDIQNLLNDVRTFNRTLEGVQLNFRLDLADLIYKHLARKGWTQKQLAEAVGVKPPAITPIMHSEKNCTLNTAASILHALGVEFRLVDVEEAEATASSLKKTVKRRAERIGQHH